MDCLLKLLSPRARIRITRVDVTQTVKALEGRHLSGPVAGRILAEGVTAVSLLSADSEPEEAVLLQARVDGPVRGVVAEMTGAGHVRGYTYEKIFSDLDGRIPVESAPALGATGTAMLQRSLPGRLLGQSPMAFTPPDFRVMLARYYNQSLQVPAGVVLAIAADAGGVSQARGLVAERMPDGLQTDFVPVLEAMHDGRVEAWLKADAPLAELAAMTGLEDLVVRETRELRFQCRCSRDKAVSSFGSLSITEIDDMVREGKPQHVVCHMCGADYLVLPAEIAR